MAAAVITLTDPTDVHSGTFGNKRVKFFDLTVDTGTYTTGGFTLTNDDFDLTHIDLVKADGLATCGTGDVTAVGLGFVYDANGESVQVLVYEEGGNAAPFDEKTSDEAYVAGTEVRLMVIGW